jgi:hypothetical protein
MRIKQHKSGLWVCDDGRVILPPCPKYPHYRFTHGRDNGKGYLRVFFRGKYYKVHRLIAEAFIPNPLNLPTVDHINRDKTANFVGNLRWADRKMQNSNKQSVDDSLAKYGVRSCNDINAYWRAYRDKNPEFAEHERARCREYRDKQKELGKHFRTCPDGKRRWLTDEEFNRLYKDGLR